MKTFKILSPNILIQILQTEEKIWYFPLGDCYINAYYFLS